MQEVREIPMTWKDDLQGPSATWNARLSDTERWHQWDRANCRKPARLQL